MRPIVDCRLGDVYQARSSSHLIYAGSRHDPGCVVAQMEQASREGSQALNPAERLGRSLNVFGRAAPLYLSSESV